MAAPPPPPPPPPRRILAPAPHAFHIHQLFHDHEHHHHQIQPPQPPPRQNEFQFLIRTTTLVLGFFLLALVFSFIAWMLFHPKTPALHVSSARIALITYTSTTAAAGDCNLTLILTNPNHHLNAVYERMEISLIYSSQHFMISKHYLPSFVQPRNNRTEVKVDMSFYLGGGGVMEAMKKDMDKGSLDLGVRVFAVLSFRNGRWKMHSQYMRGYCANLVLGFGSNGKEGVLDSRSVDCEVYLYTS